MNNKTLGSLRDNLVKYSKRQYSTEYIDSLNRRISLYGELYEPNKKGKFPVVILSHGFNGHYTDFPEECKRFAEHGYICCAFDFCGAQINGNSAGRNSDEYTPFTMKEDLRAVIADIKQKENADERQIFLFGGSQGGFVTALTAADEDIKNDIAAIAMYFPALNIPDDWRSRPIERTPLMGYSIGAEYIGSIRKLDTYGLIGNYKKDVCIVWGNQDAIVRRECIDKAVKAYGEDKTKLTVLTDAGHGFGGAVLEKAVQVVLEFLHAHTYTNSEHI
ncbi:MAG: lysophospholipase [Eubacterium sp.]|nr:lysophospholipase [Eubacterium sp.]